MRSKYAARELYYQTRTTRRCHRDTEIAFTFNQLVQLGLATTPVFVRSGRNIFVDAMQAGRKNGPRRFLFVVAYKRRLAATSVFENETISVCAQRLSQLKSSSEVTGVVLRPGLLTFVFTYTASDG